VLKKALAAALGISPAMVTKLGKRGMPVHDAEAARLWREANLDYTRGASGLARFHNRDAARAAAAKVPAPKLDATVDRVHYLARIADALLKSGDFDLIEAELRKAMHTVPLAQRPNVSMDRAIWDELIGVMLELAEPDDERGRHTQEQMAVIARFWYSIAASDDAEFSLTINEIASWATE
jgi:hypothetical protein